ELIRDGQCRGFIGNLTVQDNQATNTDISKCNNIQAMPVIIHNVEVGFFSISHTPSKPLILAFGLECNSSSGKWQWTDGTVMDYLPAAGHGQRVNNEVDADIFCAFTPQKYLVDNECATFEDDVEDGTCYQIGAAAENWNEAKIICDSFGAEVASIHNAQENAFIRRLAVSRGAVGGVFLGATPSGKGNTFAWIDGSNWDYDNFYPGFPLAGLGDCLIMDTGVTTGDWANVDCSTKSSVACERKREIFVFVFAAIHYSDSLQLYSPGYPFDASVPCDFILSVDTGKKVELEVLSLEANTCCDHLIIYDNYFGASTIANLTGEVYDKTYKTSSSNFMRVSWQPNGGVNVKGMMMTFRGV
ncbi:hypothetical protein PMAYCL1PPCAC_21387, partial [Pristionchus mayeri]